MSQRSSANLLLMFVTWVLLFDAGLILGGLSPVLTGSKIKIFDNISNWQLNHSAVGMSIGNLEQQCLSMIIYLYRHQIW